MTKMEIEFLGEMRQREQFFFVQVVKNTAQPTRLAPCILPKRITALHNPARHQKWREGKRIPRDWLHTNIQVDYYHDKKISRLSIITNIHVRYT